MELCPNSPIWDGRHFSACFGNLVAFGGNLVTILLLGFLWFTTRRRGSTPTTNARLAPCTGMHLPKVFLLILPAVMALISFFSFLLNSVEAIRGYIIEYQDWLSSCSQLVLWMMVLLFLRCEIQMQLFSNKTFCLWWILKIFLDFLKIYSLSSAWKAINWLTGVIPLSAEILFGGYVSLIMLRGLYPTERNVNSLEKALLHSETKMRRNYIRDVELGLHHCWRILTFKDSNSMFSLGVTKQLDFADLVQLPTDLEPNTCYGTLFKYWVAEQNKDSRDPSLFMAICYAYGWAYLRLGLLKALNDVIGFMGPLLLNRLIVFLQKGSGHYDGYVLAMSLGLLSTFKSFLDTQYTFRLEKLKLKLRSGIMTVVYWKCLDVSLAERSIFSEGEIQTLMSIDADRTVNLCNSFHDMWSLPLQIGVALYLLYTQVSFAFLSGLALTVLLIPVNKWISTLIASATVRMMKEKDDRIRSTGELLVHIRALKMYNWENKFASQILKKRASEVKHLSTRKYLDAWCVFFWATTPTLFSLFTFGLFTLLGHSLDAATVFTCIALFNILISPLNSFPWVINGLIDAIISTRRLGRFLSSLEHNFGHGLKDNNLGDKPDIESDDVIHSQNHQMTAISFKDAYCTWSNSYTKDQERNEKLVILKQVTLSVPKGVLVVVTGEVGSGKSSLLSSVLKEMHRVRGSIESYGSIAYVPQVPWIMSGSIRDNILFGKSFDAIRYKEVLHACALDVDISLMLEGDFSCVGAKGMNLSGGQQARLALARAVYHGSDILLLDDVLSAVDAPVASWILNKAILGPLVRERTCVLCTHNIQAISSADMIVLMDKGSIMWYGSVEDFKLSSYSTIGSASFIDSSSAHLSNNNSVTGASVVDSSQIVDDSSGTGSFPELNSDFSTDDICVGVLEDAQDSTETEMRDEGRVKFSVYKSYASFSGWLVVIVTCCSAFFMQASRNGNDLWLSYWVDNTNGTESSTKFYLVVLSIFGIVNSVMTLVRAFSFSYGGLHAAVEVHSKLLGKVTNAPIMFFDKNPSGRILNRFSSDLYAIDDSLPFILNILLANFLNLFGIVVVLSYAQVYFLVLLFPVCFLYNKMQGYYRSTSRELRRLNSIARSPIYSSFTETLDGSSTIRAFNAKEVFTKGFMDHIFVYQRTSYSELSASLWLSLRLQILAAVVITFVAIMAVTGSHHDLSISFSTPGLVGLALSYATPVVSSLSSFLTSFTETEKEMVSVERVLQYIDVPQEEQFGSLLPDKAWPMHGEIEFDRVMLRYAPCSPPALNNVSFKIRSGTKVGIIGRTGAGKSTVMNALFRLTPICNGVILVDGVNIAEIPVKILRSCLAVVPQSPFLFEGSLRENLDPFGHVSDSKIWDALQNCCIREDVEAIGGLNLLVKEGGVPFSVGQRQLICLARALIKSSKILCLDECTANIDAHTTHTLHDTILNECRDMTVVTIAHRISVVMDMDHVLVFDRGLLVEQGNPRDLLKETCSFFYSFASASNV